MSKLYDKYERLKSNDSLCLYLFLCGNFYIALDSDAMILNELFDMKLTKFSNLCDKCGFPKNALVKYEKMLKDKNIEYKIIENTELNDKSKLKKIEEIIISINIEKLTKEELKEIIYSIKTLIEE